MALVTSLVVLFYCCVTADILTKLLQQCFLIFIVVPWFYLGNSQVSVFRTIGPTLVLVYPLYTRTGGSVAEWFVRWTTKLAIRVRSRVAAGLPTGYSGLGGNLIGYCCQQYRPRLDNRGGNGTHRGLCWKQVVPSIPGGDFRRLPTLNKRPLPLPF